MSKKNISIRHPDPRLKIALLEQLALVGSYATDDKLPPDLAIVDRLDTALACPQLVLDPRPSTVPAEHVALNLPVRLGMVLDQVRYLLSGRLKHAKSFSDNLTLGYIDLNSQDSSLTNTRTGATARLTDKERLFLQTLHDAPGHMLDRQALLGEVWGYAEGVETHTLETHLYRLRQKLETVQAGDMIEAVSGGYKLKF